MRTGFVVKHTEVEGKPYFVMFEGKTPVEVTNFPMASKLINDLMPKILEGAKKNILRLIPTRMRKN